MEFSILSAHKRKSIAAIADIAHSGLLPNRYAAALAGGAVVISAAVIALVSTARYAADASAYFPC